MKLLAIIALFFLSLGCQSKVDSKNSTEQKNLVQYARFFKLEKKNGQLILQIISPDSKQAEKTILINPDQPILKAACLSATHIGMLHKLNLIDQIGAISNELYVHNPRLLKNIKKGKVTQLGEEMQIPVEKIVSSGCQAVIYSGFGNAFPHEKTLEKIGINCYANYDWREIHPLGKAEWILVLGYLMGKPIEAHAIFEQVKKEYLQLKATLSKTKTNMKVISGNMWGDLWNAPAGESYHAALLQDAGANYVYAKTKGTGSVQLSFEKIVVDAKDARFWLNPGMPSKKLILASNPKLENLEAFKNGRIYDYSKSGNRFWEMSAIEPHKVLSDYCNILTQKNLDQLFFYKPVL